MLDMSTVNEEQINSAIAKVAESRDTELMKAIALLVDVHHINLLATVGTADPFENPTLIARAQGELSGIRYIDSLIAGYDERKAAKEVEEMEDTGRKKKQTPSLTQGY